MHYQELSQATKWQMSSQNELNSLRLYANKRAREWPAQTHTNNDDVAATEGETSHSPLLQVFGFASTKSQCTFDDDTIDESSPSYGPTVDNHSHPLLNPTDESLLVSFYASKIPHLRRRSISHPQRQLSTPSQFTSVHHPLCPRPQQSPPLIVRAPSLSLILGRRTQRPTPSVRRRSFEMMLQGGVTCAPSFLSSYSSDDFHLGNDSLVKIWVQEMMSGKHHSLVQLFCTQQLDMNSL
jgi:hypothetical protein